MEKDLDQLEELVIGTNRMSGQGLREQAWQAAHGLIALGVEPEDRVAILMRNDLAQLQATLADGTRAVVRATIRLQMGHPGVQPYAVLRWREGDGQ